MQCCLVAFLSTQAARKFFCSVAYLLMPSEHVLY